ncbi:MAG: hypothetical protein RI962_1410 [Pseudomonadota bacterium]
MLPKPICSRSEYECALREMEVYFESEPVAGSAEAQRFDTLLRMVEDFEAAHYVVECPGCGEPRLELQSDRRPAATDPSSIPDQVLAEFCPGCASHLNEQSWQSLTTPPSDRATSESQDKSPG